jgi:hypothetical protein
LVATVALFIFATAQNWSVARAATVALIDFSTAKTVKWSNVKLNITTAHLSSVTDSTLPAGVSPDENLSLSQELFFFNLSFELL